MDATAVLGWFASLGAQLLSGQLLAVASDRVRSDRWPARLAEQVRDRSDIEFDRRTLREWLARPETGSLLIEPSEKAIEALVTSAQVALWRAESSEQLAEARGAAEEVVATVIAEFLFELDPSAAIGVAHYREMQLLEKIADAVGLRDEEFDELLEQLPPSSHMPLRRAREKDMGSVGRFLQAVSGEDPQRSVRELVQVPPDWFEGAPFDLWWGAAEFAVSHGGLDIACQLFRRLGEAGAPDRAYLFARGALHAAQADDSEAARDLLARARQFEDSVAFVDLVDAAIKEDVQAVSAAVDSMGDEYSEFVRAIAFTLMAGSLFKAERWDDAIKALDAAIALVPEHTGARILKARSLLARRLTGATDSPEADLFAAREVALQARDLRRTWGGESEEGSYWACVAMLLAFDWMSVLRFGLRPPLGEATPQEAEAQVILPPVAAAAIGSGRFELAGEVIEKIEDLFERPYHLAWLRERQGAPKDQVEAEYRSTWDLASNDQQRSSVQTSLAMLPAWPIPGLDELRQVNEEAADLLEALSEGERGLYDEALGRLRRWAATSRQANSLLARVYEQKGDTQAAADAFDEAHRRFADVHYLVERAELLVRAAQFEQAQHQAESALALLGADSPERSNLHKLLIEVAAQRGLWQAVEDHARALIAEGDPDPESRWALILSLLRRGAVEEAWATYNRGPGLAPVTESQAGIWLELHRRFGQGVGAVQAILEVARQFRESEQVSAMAIMAIHQVAREDPLPPELVEEVHQESERFFEQFPGSQILWRIEIGDEADMVAKLREILSRDVELPKQLARDVNLGRYPVGLLAASVGRSYTEVLIRGASGCLPIRSADPDLIETELKASEAAVGGSVVIEPSVLNSFSLCRDYWEPLRVVFRSVILTDTAVRDLVRARDDLGLRSPGTIGWDADQDRPQLFEISEREAETAAQRSGWIAEAGLGLSVRNYPHLPRFVNAEPERLGSWLSAVDLAAEVDLPLWSDDHALRSLARSMGLSAFGSLSLMEVLTRSGHLPGEALDLFTLDLRRARGVELPYDEPQILLLMAEENWRAGYSAVPLTRLVFWIDRDAAIRRLRVLCEEVAAHAPDQLAHWLQAAVVGCTRLAAPDEVSKITSGLLAYFVLQFGFAPERLRVLVGGARAFTQSTGAPDPYPAAIGEVAAALLRQYPPAIAARLGVALVSGLDAEDRLLALREFLGGGPSLIVRT